MFNSTDNRSAMSAIIAAVPDSPTGTTAVANSARTEELRALSVELEASFLAEMLKHAQFGTARSQMGGGAGEDQFASLLRMEHARAVARTGGIGLAESIFTSLVTRESAATETD